MIVDTDILIWYFRGNKKAFEFIEKQNSFFISVVTYMEIVTGMRNKHELNLFRNSLKTWNVNIFHISEEISARAAFYLEHHFLSHALQLADALIAATANVCRQPLASGNVKHFKMIDQLELIKFKPE